MDRYELKLESLNLNVVHLHQKDIGVIVTEEKGCFLLIDAKDSPEMLLMSSLFKHAYDTNDVLYLQREGPTHADLFIFNGAVYPLTRKVIKEIKTSLRPAKLKSKFELTIVSTHDESFWDRRERWKYKNQLRIHADDHLALLNASRLGLELLMNSCTHLASSYNGHSHLDWYSTTGSPELIIRNIARND